MPALADELGSRLEGKVVVDVTNRLNPDDPVATLDGTSAAERLQERLPDVPVVKAFNTAFAARQKEPTVDGARSDGFIAGDGADAKAPLQMSNQRSWQAAWKLVGPTS